MTGDIEKSCRLPVASYDADVILSAECDRSHVANPQSMSDHDCGDVLGSMRLLRSDYEILLVVLRQSANGANPGRLRDCIREIGIGESLRGKSRGIGDHLDLMQIASLHIHPTDSGHARDQRFQLVSRDVVERCGIPAFQIVG